jgi:hypothetical protein
MTTEDGHIDLFSAWVPFEALDITKGESRGPNGGDAEALLGRVRGWASSEHRDQQGDVLVQDGIDWGYFLSKGWFTYEHDRGPDNIIGHPERIEKGEINGVPATRVEGVLYLSDPRAKRMFDTSLAMQKSNSGRRLGLSIQGHALAREGKRVIKSRVLNTGVCAHPVNADMRLEALARSLEAADNVVKGVDAGYQTPADMSGAGSIAPLVKQSLSGAISNATFGAGRVSQDKMAEILQRRYGLGMDECKALAKTLASVNGG